jgi:class 3 adenylate cyclase
MDLAAIKARVKQSLEKGAQIDLSTEPCKRLLRRNVNHKIGLAVLFVDIDGSTKMSMTLSSSEFAAVLQVFSQEMSMLVSEYGGYTLKYVGDAVIALFPAQHDKKRAITNAISCGKAMLDVIKRSINPEFLAHKLPELKVKVAIEYGELLVVLYGKSLERSHVDVVGPGISMAAKMLGLSKTGQVMVGQSVFESYGDELDEKETEIVDTNSTVWTYFDEKTGGKYRVHILR